ncbi:hypothetical protein MAJHIDBO_00172 [Propionibacterium freudenreichii subsp. shermanii]|nr:hypothetical protein MAJHIDBO_00172 [Propionibacterium freudenreichii subsp. shermanii]SPS07861.1 hypothetical protein MAJHIDBO_00172 [Propionibacterium freudenreichii subsp. shermanii]
MRSRRCALAATRESWVTMITVRPIACQLECSSARISSRMGPSRFPVGSSASNTRGRFTSARAIATRCCWPPDNSLGRWSARSPIATWSSAARERSRRSSAPTPSGTRAVCTFSSADRVAIRLKFWKTMPTRSARTSCSRRSPASDNSTSSSVTVPLVGTSSAPNICSIVDLPPPVGPSMATIWPSGMVIVTRSSAVTGCLPA